MYLLNTGLNLDRGQGGGRVGGGDAEVELEIYLSEFCNFNFIMRKYEYLMLNI